MPIHSLARSSAISEGVDPRRVLDFLDAVQTAGLELHSLMVVRHGSVVAEGWWEPYCADRRHLMYSVSKTFTGAAVGLALAEGLVSLDSPVISFFPAQAPDPVDPRVAALTVHHLLSMSTGHDEDVLPRMQAGADRDSVRTFLSTPPQTPVGSRHVYNNGATNVLGAIVRAVTNQSLMDYLRPRLFDPLGISEPTWATDREGAELGWSGLHITTESLAALGELYLRDGVWRGCRLLPEGWVAASAQAQVGTGDRDSIDSTLGYGYQMWVSRHGFRADGAFGQFGLVLPDQDAVVAITAGTQQSQEILDQVWTHLLPAFSAATLAPDPAAERALTDRLARLSMQSPPHERSQITTWRATGPVPVAPGNDDGAWYPSLSDPELTRTAEGWSLTFLENGQRITIVCGDGVRVGSVLRHPTGRGVPVAASVSTSADRAAVDIVFVETPHRLRLDLVATADQTTALMGWNVPPLHHATLADLSA